MGYLIVTVIGVCLPGVDPITTVMETIPLAILFEASIWLSVFLSGAGASHPSQRAVRIS